LAKTNFIRNSSAHENNYISEKGLVRLRNELLNLVDKERPKIVDIVSWAASNGDRSENGDYIYGKKKLREIDKKIFKLTKSIKTAKPVKIGTAVDVEKVFFGASVSFKRNQKSHIETVTILGIDEVDLAKGHVSWISPIAKSLLGSRRGDMVTLTTKDGEDRLKIIAIDYNLKD
tara:strand:+ start:9918 stop:10439 length:522 start_codon:yes stop_codon:yes gene_type:complete